MDDIENKVENAPEIQNVAAEEANSGEKKVKVKFNPEKIKQFFVDLRHTDFNKFRINMGEAIAVYQQNAKIMVFTMVAMFFVMFAVAAAIFFSVVHGQEKVMVPNVTDKQLTEALLEMQAKELYPKIQLRYSEKPGDAGKVLEQNPSSGSIVKAGRRISLVVSRGVVIDRVENYVGLQLDDVRMQLQTLFAGSMNPLIVLAEPVYKADLKDPGTILEQSPAPDTVISEPVTVSLIVSRGPQFENTRVPKITGKTVDNMLNYMVTSKIVYDFSSHVAEGKQKAGTITEQQTFEEEFVPNYTRMTANFAFPQNNVDEEGNVYGILSDSLTNYPYPVPMRVEAIPPEGDPVTLISFKHPGGNFTIPYKVQKGTVLVLYVVDREHKRITVD